jgi:hypothetical protein
MCGWVMLSRCICNEVELGEAPVMGLSWPAVKSVCYCCGTDADVMSQSCVVQQSKQVCCRGCCGCWA